MALSVTSTSFAHGEPIPAHHAFGVPGEGDEVARAGGGNRNPHLAWSGAPEGTMSVVVLCVDTDVPTEFGDLNKPGTTLPASMPRQDFAHWIVVDIPPDVIEIPEGAHEGIVAGGSPTGPTSYGGVTGANGYTMFMAGDPEMGGTYGGYDGPFPPWNDELIHHYRFRVYAVDVESLGLGDDFDAAAAIEAMEGHVLDQAEHVGTYTLNPDLR